MTVILDIPDSSPAGRGFTGSGVVEILRDMEHRGLLRFRSPEGSAPEIPPPDVSLDRTLERIWAICERADISTEQFLAARRQDNNREEARFNRQSGGGDAP